MHNLFGLVALFLVPLLWLIGIIRPKTFSRKGGVVGRGKITVYAFSAFAISLLGFSMTAPDSFDPEPKLSTAVDMAPKGLADDRANSTMSDRIAAYSSRILSVNEYPSDSQRKDLNIVVELPDAWSNSSAFNATAENILDILKRIKADYAGEIGEVRINVSVAVVDKYNNPSKQNAILMVFDMPEVEKINFENLPNQRLLNNFVTRAGSSNAGKEVLQPWCAENISSADRFCSLILK